ncbi:ABC transporter permease [Draconibacterium sp. IB214405]|uniref:ABC transporter permease n=1 Tax=Draconibacterium sp. IB214405 TaxID=3097352 RepID=UPI002A0C5F0B|nr:ABC transporter permease [Draconibacterium sp. IB214405]MDX8337730.1 ABC transporter permease [Draconibacterium sp. IB214405]
MNINYLKQAARGIRSQKFYSLINLLGLTAGITAFILIALWVYTELTFDNFQTKADQIYRIDYKLYEEDVLEQYSASAVPVIGPMLEKTYPEVENYTRFKKIEGVVKHGDTFYKEENIFYAESSFFELFDFKLEKGEKNNTILDVNKAVITQQAAKKYFGNENPVGKYLELNGSDRYFISAVAADIPKNSHIKFDILLSYENLINQVPYFEDGWFVEEFYTYVKLLPGTDFKKLEAKIPEIVEQHLGDFMKEALFLAEFKLRPFNEIHLYSNLKNELEVNGDINQVKYMSVIAVLVLVIALINYINLSTSHSAHRASEVGVRKVLGAFRKHLFGQFLTESYLISLLAFILSVGLVFLLLPSFRALTGSPVTINRSLVPLVLLVLYLGCSFLTGIIPASILMRVNPATVLKGKSKGHSKTIGKFRNGLVVFQFTISVILIVATLFISKQMTFLQKQNLGIDIDQVLVVEGPQEVNSETVNTESSAFRSEMLNLAAVKNMTVSTNVPGEEVMFQPVYGKLITGVNTEKKIRMIGIDQHFFDTYNLKLLAGRNFDENYNPEIREVVLNESALEYLGFENEEQAIGQKLTGDPGEARVIGVVNDYNQKSLREKPGPMLFCNKAESSYYSLKINAAEANQVIAELEELWNKKFAGNPFHYFFLDEYFNKQYAADLKFGSLFLIFSIMAIFIACLGLLGLSAYSTAQRTKEIGVRKVNGAKISEILTMLNKDFVKWILVAFMIATPVAYYAMNKWLENFAYKTTLSWWIFALAGVMALGIALLTVSWQSWRAATRNPVEALRYE